MYKEVMITIIIVILIVTIDIFANRYTEIVTEDLSNNLLILKNELTNASNTQKKEIKIDTILSNWKQYYKLLAYYIEHDELEKVETELTKLKAYLESQNYDESINEIDTIIFILNHIKDKEKFTLQSIF